MTKRGFILGEYDTAADGHFTLNKWSLSEPKQKTNYLSIAYGDANIEHNADFVFRDTQCTSADYRGYGKQP